MFSATLLRAICAIGFLLPAIVIFENTGSAVGSAQAQSTSSAEKDAFEAAKELGTVEAWDAFLSNYSTGFHADLARAYVKKLADGPSPNSVPAAAAKHPGALVYSNPEPAGSWGGIVRSGPGQDFSKVESLDEGERISLIERTDVVTNDFPWFKISFRGGKTGYKWGGILCSVSEERADIFKTCPPAPVATTERKNASENKTVEPVTKSCSAGRIKIDGRCIRKRDAATHCGPGYRLKGNKCVSRYAEPKPQKQLPSWQAEAIKKGCKPGQGWNAQEGCHEND